MTLYQTKLSFVKIYIAFLLTAIMNESCNFAWEFSLRREKSISFAANLSLRNSIGISRKEIRFGLYLIYSYIIIAKDTSYCVMDNELDHLGSSQLWGIQLLLSACSFMVAGVLKSYQPAPFLKILPNNQTSDFFFVRWGRTSCLSREIFNITPYFDQVY